MRHFLGALTLGATIFLAATTAFADEKTDPTYYTDRIMSSSQPSVSAAVSARSAQDIYLELRQENMGQ